MVIQATHTQPSALCIRVSILFSYVEFDLATVCDSKKLTFHFLYNRNTIVIVTIYESFSYAIVFQKNITITQQ